MPIQTACLPTTRFVSKRRVLVNHFTLGENTMSDTVAGKKKKRKARKGSKKVAKKMGMKKKRRAKKK
jgi:ABC-type lipoprotein export system ATPase subunit